MGYDPIWFGQVITIVNTMGFIMPPIGICCYAVSGMSGIPLRTVFQGGLYYMPSYINFHLGVDGFALRDRPGICRPGEIEDW